MLPKLEKTRSSWVKGAYCPHWLAQVWQWISWQAKQNWSFGWWVPPQTVKSASAGGQGYFCCDLLDKVMNYLPALLCTLKLPDAGLSPCCRWSTLVSMSWTSSTTGLSSSAELHLALRCSCGCDMTCDCMCTFSLRLSRSTEECWLLMSLSGRGALLSSRAARFLSPRWSTAVLARQTGQGKLCRPSVRAC